MVNLKALIEEVYDLIECNGSSNCDHCRVQRKDKYLGKQCGSYEVMKQVYEHLKTDLKNNKQY
jgi:hypothetical protein